jgi:periplasmic copper chaperone A
MTRWRVGALLGAVGLAGAALAGDMARVGDLVIQDGWARATLGQLKTSAAYLTVINEGDAVDRLVAAASPAAERAALHTHLMEHGVAKMRPVDAIEVAPGAPIVLQPGGLHVMLMGLKAPLAEGETLPLTLTFETAGSVELELPVLGMAGMGQGQSRGHGEGHGHGPSTN